jgi:preprotein translocase subunit SecE
MLRNRERTDIQKSRRPAERKSPPQRDMVTRKGPKSSNPIIRYFQDTGEELRKVSWPNREQTIRLTVIVLSTTAVTAVFLGALDYLFRFLSSLLVGAG